MAVWFEWDERKNRINIAKHGIGFEEASGVFSDPHVIIREDRVVDGEQRLHAIGNVGRVLIVVHTVKGKGIRRYYPHHLGSQSHAGGEKAV